MNPVYPRLIDMRVEFSLNISGHKNITKLLNKDPIHFKH